MPDTEVAEKPAEAPPEGGVSTSEPEKEKHTGPVELTPQQQALFNREFRARKDLERAVNDLRDLNGALYAKLEEMDVSRAGELRQQTEAQLTDQITKATQRGDWARVSTLNSQLIDIKAEAKARDVLKASTPKPAKVEKKAEVDPDMVDTLSNWANELDDNMNYKRPYAQVGHPLQKKAAALGQALMDDPAYGGDLNRVLAELDRQMTGGGRPTAAVLSPNSRSVKGGVTLTAEQKEVARRMGIGEEKYAKQLEITRR